jgi:hypothetical protein
MIISLRELRELKRAPWRGRPRYAQRPFQAPTIAPGQRVPCVNVDKYPAPACGPPREIFGKARPAVLKLYAARGKARSSESMLVPC